MGLARPVYQATSRSEIRRRHGVRSANENQGGGRSGRRRGLGHRPGHLARADEKTGGTGRVFHSQGSGAQAKEVATRLFERFGEERMGEFCKLHFKTAYEAMGKTPPAKKSWNPNWRK